MNPERGTCNTVWNAKDEKIDDDDDDDNSSALYIRRISWLAPQQEGAEGCLFVLIGKEVHCIPIRCPFSFTNLPPHLNSHE